MPFDSFARSGPQTRRTCLRAALAGVALLTAAMSASAATAVPVTHVAVASLLGDSFATVTRQDSTGSHLDTNLRNSFKLPEGVLDTPALLAVEAAIKKDRQATEVSLMKLNQSEALAEASRLQVGAKFSFPAGLQAAFKQINASHFILVTPVRGLTLIKGYKEGFGNGTLEGLGFFVDRNSAIRRAESEQRRVGYIAPYSYFKLSLFDLQRGGELIASKTINQAVMYADYDKGLSDPWEMLDMQGKLNLLIDQLKGEIGAAVPALLASQ